MEMPRGSGNAIGGDLCALVDCGEEAVAVFEHPFRPEEETPLCSRHGMYAVEAVDGLHMNLDRFGILSRYDTESYTVHIRDKS